MNTTNNIFAAKDMPFNGVNADRATSRGVFTYPTLDGLTRAEREIDVYFNDSIHLIGKEHINVNRVPDITFIVNGLKVRIIQLGGKEEGSVHYVFSFISTEQFEKNAIANVESINHSEVINNFIAINTCFFFNFGWFRTKCFNRR